MNQIPQKEPNNDLSQEESENEVLLEEQEEEVLLEEQEEEVPQQGEPRTLILRRTTKPHKPRQRYSPS